MYACAGKQEKTKKDDSMANAIPEMSVDSSDGSNHISLHISKADRSLTGSVRYTILSTYENKPAGFILLKKNNEKNSMFVPKGIQFLSMGDTSNNFLNALSKIYNLPQQPRVFADSLTITFADLAAGVDLKKEGNWVAAQLKLFFETKDDNPELYLDIDEKDSNISFSEKDSAYRAGIVEALSKKKK